ncbi:MAG: uroporphyrinogen decarboxylase family protein [Armatimonadota bacterium]
MTAVMSSRERVATLLRHELPDRIGLYDHYWPETIRDYWSTQGYPVDVPPEEYFDYDLVTVSGWFNASPFKDQRVVVEESDEWTLAKDGNGATLRLWKNKSGTPEHVAFDCTTPERWEAIYKPPLLEFDPTRLDIPAAREKLAHARARGKYAVYGGWTVYEQLRATLGDVTMLESLALEPEWIHDFCDTFTNFLIRHIDYLFNEAGQPDGAFIYEDLGYNKGLFCSPTMYHDLIMPYHQRLFSFFHDRGMPVILHSCGKVAEAVPYVIEAGVDCLQPMEAKTGLDVVELARQFGDRLSFMGNIDVRVLEGGDRAAIEAEVAGKMEAMKALKAAYFLHTDHSISPKVTFESYKYMLEVYRAHCRY